MRISATGSRLTSPDQRGFTLVEVMTVVLILGLVAGIVILTLPGERDPARAEAFRLAEQVRAAGESAITTGTLGGLSAGAESYTFKVWREGGWQAQAVPGAGNARHDLDDEVTLLIAVQDEPQTGTAGTASGERRFMLGTEEREELAEMPVIVFPPGGAPPAFMATLSGPQRDWRVIADSSGAIRVEALDE